MGETQGRRDAKIALAEAGVGERRGAKVALERREWVTQGRKGCSGGEEKVGWGRVSGCGGAECGCVVDCWDDGACDRRGDGAGGRIGV